MYCWPCISIDPCNGNQHVAIFIRSLFRQSVSNVSGIFVAHHQEVHCICTAIGKCYAFQLIVCWSVWNGIFLPDQQTVNCIYGVPPDDGLQICPKHVEVYWRNKLRINSASSWFSLHGSNRYMTCFLGRGNRMYRLYHNGQKKVGYWTITVIFIQSQQQRSQLAQNAWRNSHNFGKIEDFVRIIPRKKRRHYNSTEKFVYL